MSKRPPEHPLMPRHNGFRRIDEIMDELLPQLGLQRPPRSTRDVVESAIDASKARPRPVSRDLSTNAPKVVPTMDNDSTNDLVGNLRMAKLAGIAANCRLIASALRGIVATAPSDLSALPHARLGAELERFQGGQLDWAAWWDERAEEAERAAVTGGES